MKSNEGTEPESDPDSGSRGQRATRVHQQHSSWETAPGQVAHCSNGRVKGQRGSLQTRASGHWGLGPDGTWRWGISLHCRVLSGNPGPHSLGTRRTPSRAVTTKNVFRHCRTSAGRQHHPQLRLTAVHAKRHINFFKWARLNNIV